MSQTEKDCYGSDFLADYYDVVVVPTLGGDGPTYWAALKKMRELLPNSTTRMLDIGTGTGRVIRDLATNIEQDKGDFSNTEFIGLDLSQAMVDNAASLPLNALSSKQVSWIQGSALDLEAALPASQRPVDLLIFAFASICHLHEPGQVDQFFRQVAKVLRPGTGRAMVSMHNDVMLNNPNPPVLLVQADEPFDIRGKRYPNMIYRTVEKGYETDGNVRHYKCSVTMLDCSDGQERILQTNETSTAVRMTVDEEELPTIASQQGLRNVDRIRNGYETIYVFAL
jgi:SAM-dependent methyltransferase